MYQHKVSRLKENLNNNFIHMKYSWIPFLICKGIHLFLWSNYRNSITHQSKKAYGFSNVYGTAYKDKWNEKFSSASIFRSLNFTVTAISEIYLITMLVSNVTKLLSWKLLNEVGLKSVVKLYRNLFITRISP